MYNNQRQLINPEKKLMNQETDVAIVRSRYAFFSTQECTRVLGFRLQQPGRLYGGRSMCIVQCPRLLNVLPIDVAYNVL
jgi:hypothetical protein